MNSVSRFKFTTSSSMHTERGAYVHNLPVGDGWADEGWEGEKLLLSRSWSQNRNEPHQFRGAESMM
jgi:hypothetical protein